MGPSGLPGDPAVAIFRVRDFQRLEPEHDDIVLNGLPESSGLHGILRCVPFEAIAQAGEQGEFVGGGGFADFGLGALIGHVGSWVILIAGGRGGAPEGLEFGLGGVGELAAVLGEGCFHAAEAALEFVQGVAGVVFGVSAGVFGLDCQVEGGLAEVVVLACGAAEAVSFGAAEDGLGTGEGGHGAGDAVEDGSAFGAFGRLEAFPCAFDPFGGAGFRVGEDVGVAADELGADAFGDVAEVEAAVLFGDFGVEDDLEEEVAELFAEFGGSAVRDGVEDFVGFFQEVRAEAEVGLGEVPGAAVVGIAQAVDDGAEAFGVVADLEGIERRED